MKKFKSIFIVMAMLLIGGLANVRATIIAFYGEANSLTWYTVNSTYKSTNDRMFDVSTDVMGSPDRLSFRAISQSGYEICRLTVTEGYRDYCYYPSDIVSSAGSYVRAEVISVTPSVMNFPIKGVIDYR